MPPRREPGRQQQAFEDLLDPAYQAFLNEDQKQGPRKHLSKRQWKKSKQKQNGSTPGFQLKETAAGPSANPTDTEKLLEMFGDSLDMGLVLDVYVSNKRSLAHTIDALFALGIPQPMETEHPEAGPSAADPTDQIVVKIEDVEAQLTTLAGEAGGGGGRRPTTFSDLPEDVKLDIWRRLRLKEMSQAARTCKEFAERVHSLRAGMRALNIPAGLSFSAIKGMVEAYHQASHVSLAKCAPQMRHSLDIIRYLGAVVSGQHERRSGVPITLLDLRGCQAMGDSDVASLLDMFDSLEEVHLANCSRLTDGAVQSLAKYRRTEDDEECFAQHVDSQTVEVVEPFEKHAEQQQATAGCSSDAAEGSGAVEDEDAGQEDRQVSVQRTLVEESLERLKEAQKPRPVRLKAGGLRTLTLAGCSLVTQRGISPMFHGTAAMKSLEALDVSRCPCVNERCMFSISKSQNVLRTLRANECSGLMHVTLLLAESHPLEDIQISGCKNLREVTVSAERLRCLNLGACVNLNSLDLRAPALEKLKLHGSRHLVQMQMNSLMPQLRDINIYGCLALNAHALDALLILAHNVEELHANGCVQLTNLTLQDQDKLRWLDLSGCKLMTRVLVTSSKLHTLRARHCSRLTGITLWSIELQELALSNCTCLTNIQLPGVNTATFIGDGSWALKGGPLRYNIDGCANLPRAMVAKLEALAKK